jgi:hypothetical protein
MIAIKNRKMLIPNEERYIGTTFDENSQVLSFKVSRYTQNDIDLSALNAKADVYHCATETEDRADLTMEVQAKYIILHLYITAGMVATPGTVLIDLKLFNDDGEIKWSSYRGAFFVDDPLASPSGETSLTELEQLEARINRAIATAYDKAAEVVGNWLDENIGEIEGYVIDKSLTVENAAADAKTVGDELYNMKAALKSTPVTAQRIFRRLATRDAGNLSDTPTQSITNTGSSFIVCGRVSLDNSYQRINEYSLSGELIRTKLFNDADFGHGNGCCYDADRQRIYIAGTGLTLVVVDYTTLDIIEKHTLTGITGNLGSVDYDNGTLYGLSSRQIVTIALPSYECEVIAQYTAPSVNPYISLVPQDMAVHDGYAYIVYNCANQLLKVRLSDGEMESFIYLGEGNGVFPYGELESATFVNGQLHFISAVWNGSGEGSYSYMQVFATSIGGVVAVRADNGQSSFAESIIYVNYTDSDSTDLNPDGTTSHRFARLYEACMYLNYQVRVQSNHAYRLNISAGANHDYTQDKFMLTGMTCYIDAYIGEADSLPTMALYNGTYFVRRCYTSQISARFSTVKISQSAVSTLNATYCIVYCQANSATNMTLEGCLFLSTNYEQVKNSTRDATAVLGLWAHSESHTNAQYLSSDINFDCYNRVCTMSWTGGTITLPTDTLTTVLTLPDNLKPVRDYVYDLIDYTEGSWYRLRIYIRENGNLQIYNYSQTRTQYTNTRAHITYMLASTF